MHVRRPSWFSQWHADALAFLGLCAALGLLGGLTGAIADRRLGQCSRSCPCSTA
jgi:hypothetical protein